MNNTASKTRLLSALSRRGDTVACLSAPRPTALLPHRHAKLLRPPLPPPPASRSCRAPFSTSATSAYQKLRALKPYLFAKKEKRKSFNGHKLPKLNFFEPPEKYYYLDKPVVRDPKMIAMPAADEITAAYERVEALMEKHKDILPKHGLPDANIRRVAYEYALQLEGNTKVPTGFCGPEIKSLEEIRDWVVRRMEQREINRNMYIRRYKKHANWARRTSLKAKYRRRRLRSLKKSRQPF